MNKIFPCWFQSKRPVISKKQNYILKKLNLFMVNIMIILLLIIIHLKIIWKLYVPNTVTSK